MRAAQVSCCVRRCALPPLVGPKQEEKDQITGVELPVIEMAGTGRQGVCGIWAGACMVRRTDGGREACASRLPRSEMSPGKGQRRVRPCGGGCAGKYGRREMSTKRNSRRERYHQQGQQKNVVRHGRALSMRQSAPVRRQSHGHRQMNLLNLLEGTSCCSLRCRWRRRESCSSSSTRRTSRWWAALSARRPWRLSGPTRRW